MDYQSALDYLYSFVDFEAKPADVYAPERFNLERVRGLLERLGNPHGRYASVHIAGTKGKGSLAAMVESVLRAAGHSTGLFTSPHLQDFRERIRVDRKMIAHDSLAALIAELRPHIPATADITFYEISTALALEWFARQGVEIAVLEVGLGGRLDATNVVAPAVCAIMPISFDHVELLGDTIESIAVEKAGIIKCGVPVVVAPQPVAAQSVLRERTAAIRAPLIDVDAAWAWDCEGSSAAGQQFALWPTARPQDKCNYQLPLLGTHQVENAAVAVALVQQLREQGWSIPQRAIARGLKTVQWPARCEVLPGEPPVMLDCAHNRASAKRLAETLQDFFPGLPRVLVFGAMRDKDVAGMFAELLPGCSAAIMTSTGTPRAMLPGELLRAAAAHDCAATAAGDLFSALAQAKHAATPAGIVVVTGSVALAGAARAAVLEDAALSAAVPL